MQFTKKGWRVIENFYNLLIKFTETMQLHTKEKEVLENVKILFQSYPGSSVIYMLSGLL
jgi:hypothetical protein